MNRARIWRVLPILVALGITWWINDKYGTHPVELIFALPAGVTVPESSSRPAFSVRIVRPDGKLVLGLEAGGAAGTHTVVVHTRLPRGSLEAQAWVVGNAKPLSGKFVYAGEEEIEIALSG